MGPAVRDIQPRLLTAQVLFGPTYCAAVYKNGDVCISILHDPGDDKYGPSLTHDNIAPRKQKGAKNRVLRCVSHPSTQAPTGAVCKTRLESKKNIKFQPISFMIHVFVLFFKCMMFCFLMVIFRQRKGMRALAAHPYCHNNRTKCDINAGRPKRYVSSKRRCGGNDFPFFDTPL